jgi:hypothetical protein
VVNLSALWGTNIRVTWGKCGGLILRGCATCQNGDAYLTGCSKVSHIATRIRLALSSRPVCLITLLSLCCDQTRHVSPVLHRSAHYRPNAGADIRSDPQPHPFSHSLPNTIALSLSHCDADPASHDVRGRREAGLGGGGVPLPKCALECAMVD